MSGVREGRLHYFAFDLLHLDGEDLAPAPLEERKRRLSALLAGGGTEPIVYSDHVVGSGPAFYAEACRKGLEGIVSKRRDAVYRPGRGRDWLKVKCRHEQEVVIGGYTAPQGSRVGLGALLVGVHDEQGRLQYAGKVGTGFSDATLGELTRRLKSLEQPDRPFASSPPARRPRSLGAARARRPGGVRRVDERRKDAPPVVPRPARGQDGARGRAGEAGGTSRSRRRQGEEGRAALRRRPRVPGTPGGRRGPRLPRTKPVAGVRLTHPDRVLYDPPGTTKRDLASYYVSVESRILPHVEGRPLALVRCPDGAHKECFFQKHAGHYAPKELRRVTIPEARKLGEYLVVDDLQGLVGLVQMGVLELHTWGSRVERLEQPDLLVFDVDPDEGLPWERVVEATLLLRARLEGLDLATFLKSTGGKGLHVVAPLRPRADWKEVSAFAQALALDIVRKEPKAYTAEASKARRKGKVFVDYLRNHRGASAVVPYSTRAKAGAPIAVPLAWDELGQRPIADSWTIQNAAERLKRPDPWADFDAKRQPLTARHRKALGIV